MQYTFGQGKGVDVMPDFVKGQYDVAYAREHIKRKHIPFNDQKPEDMEIPE